MNDNLDERLGALREATDGILPSPAFMERALAPRLPSLMAVVERRGLWIAGACGLACAVLVASNVLGFRSLDDLLMHTLLELPL